MSGRSDSRSLLVVVPDRVSDFASKGEVISRYYNPARLFEKVDVLLTNEDHPPLDAIRRMVGDAAFEVHNVPTGRRFALRTLAFRSSLVRTWTNKVVELARYLQPSLIRCYGAEANVYAALQIKHTLGIPYAVSLHTVPEFRAESRSGLRKLRDSGFRHLIHQGLRHADAVMPVYKSIIPYLRSMGLSNYQLAYNMLNPDALRAKETYGISKSPRIICVGRQIPGKNPENIISAMGFTTDAHLTVVGDGPDHEDLKKHAATLGLAGRVDFHRRIPNDELCRILPTFDIFTSHTDFPELPKATLEALVSGLPVICNRQNGEAVPELSDDICMLVNNTPRDYAGGLKRLINDESLRASLGHAAYEQGQREWIPEKTEAKYAEIYEQILHGRNRVRH